MVLTSAKVKLLKKAVRKLTDSSDIARGRIPWKKVGDYIGRWCASFSLSTPFRHNDPDPFQLSNADFENL
jgi:acetylornithine deacetylase/succinyl-diaminopimelate desuccinylase-like protein